MCGYSLIVATFPFANPQQYWRNFMVKISLHQPILIAKLNRRPRRLLLWLGLGYQIFLSIN
jgi:hypothetical protein